MKKILVIEDEKLILENILETLDLEGFEAVGAPNGLLGVEKAYEFMPDLIICDIMMPEMDGYGVLLELRSNPQLSLTPFIFLTARSERADMRYGMELGADDYITKPFLPSELLAAVNMRFEKQAAITGQFTEKIESLRANIIHSLPHELRTPLTGILAGADILMDDLEDDAHSIMMLKIIHKAGLRLQHLIENYLVYAQIELIASDQNRIAAMRKSQFSKPRKLVEEIAPEKAANAERVSDLALVEVEDANVCVSPEDFRKIVEELVDNAFKFSEEGQPVQVRAVANNGCYVLSISDQGRGMTQDQIASIGAYMQFERRFYEQQGLGLGLVVSKRLTELYGGEFVIDSTVGQGTTVTAKLPM